MVLAKFCLFLVFAHLIYPSLSDPDDYDEDQQSSDDAVSIFWGISDREAVVGRLFQCKIPPERDAFKGTIVEYDVEGEKPNTLPKWLIFDKKRSILEGVATVEDIGDTRINVKAYDSKGKSVNDMFVIEVYPLENENTNTKRKCRSGEEVMMLAIVIDRNLDDISPSQRISVVRTLARALNIPQNTILLLPQPSSFDSSSDFLRADPKFNDTNVDSSVLTWQIGCNERIWAEQLEIVNLVKKMIKGNNLADMLQLPINHWRLIANFNPFRMRRHVPDMALDEPAEDEDDDSLDDSEDEDAEDKISSSPSVDDLSSSVMMNETSPSLQSSVEDNSNWSHSSNISKSELTHHELSSNAEDEEAGTEQPDTDVENSLFGRQNESVSSGPTPSLESSVTPFRCISCSSTDGNISTEKVTIAPTSTRLPPRMNKNIGPIIVTAGKPRKEPIPEDTFIDEGGDGNTRNLTLKLIQKSTDCKPETVWIELDSETQTLLILASSEAISQHDIPLEATNSANMSSTAMITIVVQHPQQDRKINFEISFHLNRKNKDQRVTTRLQLELLSLISVLYGDASTDLIMLRHISCDPFIFTWTNTSLSLETCDSSTIHNLLMVLVNAEGSNEVNEKVRQTIDPLVNVDKITWVGKGLCDGILPDLPLFKSLENSSPVVRNHVDNITARVGELLVYQIPDDAFHDPDVTSMRNLKLMVKFLGDRKPLPPNNWLQFDDKNQEIYGLPMNSDVGLTSYMVICYDNKETENEEKAVRQTIEVKVEPALKIQYSVEFSIRLNSSYTSFEEFNRVPMLRRILVKKLSEVFGDKDTSSIVVSGYQTGSLIVIWHNKTLPVNTCPNEEIEKLRKVILTDKNELTERVNKILEPEFQAISALLAPTGICEGGQTETHVTEVPIKTASQEIQLFFSKMDFNYFFQEYFIDVIVPIIIIILMMIFAGIVACILYRRQRRAKWNLNDETERRTYRNRGIPVIFQDELEERLETSNKSPIIMKEEKPPLPPPEYQKTLPMATTALLSDFDDPSYHQDSRSYSPRTAERSGRDQSSTPTYRKPPPYIPP